MTEYFICFLRVNLTQTHSLNKGRLGCLKQVQPRHLNCKSDLSAWEVSGTLQFSLIPRLHFPIESNLKILNSPLFWWLLITNY